MRVSKIHFECGVNFFAKIKKFTYLLSKVNAGIGISIRENSYACVLRKRIIINSSANFSESNISASFIILNIATDMNINQN